MWDLTRDLPVLTLDLTQDLREDLRLICDIQNNDFVPPLSPCMGIRCSYNVLNWNIDIQLVFTGDNNV